MVVVAVVVEVKFCVLVTVKLSVCVLVTVKVLLTVTVLGWTVIVGRTVVMLSKVTVIGLPSGVGVDEIAAGGDTETDCTELVDRMDLGMQVVDACWSDGSTGMTCKQSG